MAVLANGMLVTGREVLTHPGRWQIATLVAGLVALVAAVAVLLLGLTRSRVLACDPAPRRGSAGTTMALTTSAILVLCVALLGVGFL